MISFYAIERVGRRRLILVGGCIAFSLNLIIGSLGQAVQTEPVQSAALAVICMWVFNYAICFAGTGWTLAGEVATPRLRAKTASFTAFSNAVAGAIYDTTVSEACRHRLVRVLTSVGPSDASQQWPRLSRLGAQYPLHVCHPDWRWYLYQLLYDTGGSSITPL